MFNQFAYTHEKISNTNKKFNDLKINLQIAFATKNNIELTLKSQNLIEYLEIVRDEFNVLKEKFTEPNLLTTNKTVNNEAQMDESDFNFESLEKWNNNLQILEICNLKKTDQSNFDNLENLKEIFSIDYLNSSEFNVSDLKSRNLDFVIFSWNTRIKKQT